MNCQINDNLLEEKCIYSIGGISKLFILDMDNFQDYKFNDDNLYDEILLDYIYHKGKFYEIEASDNAVFTEKYDNKLFTKQLKTSVGKFSYEIEKQLTLSVRKQYLVAFRSYNNGKWFVFDNATLIYDSTIEAKAGSIQYNLTFDSTSDKPLYEMKADDYFSTNLDNHSTKYSYYPIFDTFTCELKPNTTYNTGYKVANYCIAEDIDGIAVDKNGKEIDDNNKNKQAIITLEGTSNPDASKYEVVSSYTQSYQPNSGESLKKYDVNSCWPHYEGTITINPSTMQILSSNKDVTATVYSTKNWTNTTDGNVYTNMDNGVGGTFNVTYSRINYGNSTVTLKNIKTREEITATVQCLLLSADKLAVSLANNNPSTTINITCKGGTADYSITNPMDWLTVNKGTNSITITAANNTGDTRNGYITLSHNDNANEKVSIYVIQQNKDVFEINEADYIVMTYTWDSTAGTDMDESTYILNSGISNVDYKNVGFGGTGQDNNDVTPYLQGLIGKNSREEKILINVAAVHTASTVDEVFGDSRGNFYGSLGTGLINLEIKGYKGGTMDTSFNNNGGTLVKTVNVSKMITASGSCNYLNATAVTAYTAVVAINMIKSSNLVRFVLSDSTVGNKCTVDDTYYVSSDERLTASTFTQDYINNKCNFFKALSLQASLSNKTDLNTITIPTSYNCTAFTSTFLSNTNLHSITLNTDAAQSMLYTFRDCKSLTAVNLSNTSKVNDFELCFYGDSNLTSITLDTSSTTGLVNTFRDCTSLTSVNLSNTSKVSNFGFCFCGCNKLNNLNLDFGSNINSMSNTFDNCSGMTNLIITNLGKQSAAYNLDVRDTIWGYNGNSSSVISSLVTNSFDRKSAGYNNFTLWLAPVTYYCLNSSNLSTLANKGYTVNKYPDGIISYTSLSLENNYTLTHTTNDSSGYIPYSFYGGFIDFSNSSSINLIINISIANATDTSIRKTDTIKILAGTTLKYSLPSINFSCSQNITPVLKIEYNEPYCDNTIAKTFTLVGN